MLAEHFKLAECEVQFGIFVSEATEILRRVLEILHGGSSFRSYWFDNFEHLRRSFTEIRNTFAREHFTVFCATGVLRPLCDVDCHVAEQSQLHQPRVRIAVDRRFLVYLDLDPNFILRLVWFGPCRHRARSRAWPGWVRFGFIFLRAPIFCARDWRH